MSALPGYYGKVVTHGDFVARRLPVDFVACWDAWLQDSLHASRGALGDGWRDVYLISPLWRFATGAGVCGALPMAGVMAPGVDSVGRYFPLTLAGPASRPPAASWYEALEQLALGSLAPRFSLAALDAALADLGPPTLTVGAVPPGVSGFWSDVTVSGLPVAKSFVGLPAPGAFAALLEGRL